jgi:hypothetical protein
MSLADLVGVLQQYTGASASNPPASAQQDFQKVAEQAPQAHLAGGLAEAFRSDQTPPFPQMLASLFSQSNGQQKAGLLSQLLDSAGLASGATAGSGMLGSLSSLLTGGSSINPQQADEVTPDQVQQLAEHAQKANPSIIEQASSFYAQHPQIVQGLGAGALALIMAHVSKRA